MDNKIKVLQIVPSLSMANGVAACISNYFTNIDKRKYEFTFATLNDRDHGRYKIIEENGGKIVELYRNNGLIKYIKNVDNFFKNNQFDIVHCNVANTGLIFLYFAKKYNVKVRILHSHATSSSDNFLKKIRNDLILIFTKRLANTYFACSNAAGKSMFGKNEFYVLNNCVDNNKYKFDEAKRINLRKQYNLENDLVIGNIGRLCNQKNQKFLIDLLSQIDDCKLMIIGNGPLESKLKEYARQKEVEDRVIFTGSIENTYELYNVFDIFVLSSLYEGLPVVGVEAQANGLPCIFSTNITNEVKINKNVEFLNLDCEIWKSKLTKHGRVNQFQNRFLSSNFNIDNEVKKLEAEYNILLSKQ